MSGPNPITRLNAALEGRYRIESELGEGGMANVYLADDLKHERKVALKVLKPELAAVVGAERFLAEIKTTANLQHPHILPLFDSGEADSFLFYVMPFVEGETLRDRLEREKQLPVDEAVRIATDVAEALQAAHEQGVIHRDIKPANILMSKGRPLVADFGIALAVSAAGGGRLTETGMSIGSPFYMSPEQATADREASAASDVYSLGCVLYEMLVGEPPFTGGSAQAVLGKIISTEAPSARVQRKSVPANIDAVLRRSLEKLPADRFSGAQGFAHAMGVPGFRHGETAGPGRGLGLRGAVGLGALAGALGLLIGWTLLGGGPAQVEFGDVRKVTFDPGLELMSAISPDGQDVAYVAAASTSDSARILVRSLSGGQPTRISDEWTGGEAFPQWSPDGGSIAFTSDEGVGYQVGARGGTPRPIAQIEAGRAAGAGAWSPDGARMAYIRSEEDFTVAWMVVREDGVERRVAEVAASARSLRWSPDGRWIAYVTGGANWSRLGRFFGNVAPSSVMVVAATGGDPVEVAPPQYLNTSPAFLPDGRLLFVSGRGGVRDIYMIQLTQEGKPAGEARRITAGLNPHSISVSADGRRLSFGTMTRRQNVYALAIPTSGVVSAYSGTPTVVGPQVIEGVAVSPDGQWLAFDSNRAGPQAVYRRRRSGGETLQVTTSLSDAFVRSWSRDGSIIAGHGFNQGVRDIWVADPDGLSFGFVSPSPSHDRYPDFSPDGRRIAFQSERDEPGIFVMELDADGQWGAATRAGPGRRARWSPDGKMIASVTPDGISLMSPGGGESRLIPLDGPRGSAEGVEWVSDQQLLVQRWLGDGTAGVWSLSRTSGSLQQVIRFDDPVRQPRHEMAVHDGTLYFTIGEFEADIWMMEVDWR